uniref:phosphopantetheine-binding protein n=1 Tax=Streptomyces chartreusis TaxID=1969 RepID=UPI003F4940B7
MTDTSSPHPFTLDRLRKDIAELLYVDVEDVEVDEDVFHQGLDSVRMMALVEGWRADGAEAGFAELAEQPTLTAWASLLSTTGAPRASA